MSAFLKLTRTNESDGGEIWVSQYQIIYMEEDENSRKQIHIQLTTT